MSSCDRVQPLLVHVAEGELTPEEAMRVARHLADCTVCKIGLARERRLGELLERELEDLPVGEEFVQSVMATLPQGPPPGRPRKHRRGLKLAALAGFLGAGALTLAELLAGGGAATSRVGLPAADFEGARGSLEALAGLVRSALVALEAMRSLPLDAPTVGGGLELLGAVAMAATMCMCAGSLLFALAACSLVRVRR
jgi:anti-sigma factor RsiW